MIKSKKQMFIVIGAFALVMLLGEITYAFFNYTRTGTANVIRTGQINFTTTQTSGQNGAISLTNVFPVDVSEGIPANDPNVGEVTINITGNTEYTGGIEYLVTATNVTNTVGSKTIPIGISVTASSGLGTSDADYYVDRESNLQTSIYKVLAGDSITSNTDLVVGYIKSGQTGVNGNVVIKAYLDDSKIAISDTYYENATATPTPTAPTDEYGTPASFGEGKVVLTTTEWNSLRTNGISFQVKVEAKEDIWVPAPAAPLPSSIASCPGCVFVYTTNEYTLQYSVEEDWDYVAASTTDDIIDNGDTIYTSYSELMNATGKRVFLGLKIDETTNEVEKAYVCGIFRTDNQNLINNNGNAFCIEGTTDGSASSNNVSLIDGASLWNGTCVTETTYEGADDTTCGDASIVEAVSSTNGYVKTHDSENNSVTSCTIYANGPFECTSYTG